MKRFAILLLPLFFLLSACGAPQDTTDAPPAEASAVASPTVSAAPGETLPPPTGTSQPSPSAQPSPTLQSSPTPLPTVGPGSVMLSRGDWRPMVFVPAGDFLMGAAPDDPAANADEKPQHKVTLDAFWIDQFEVTHQEYAQCVEAGACQPPAEKDNNGFDYEFAAQIEDAAVVNVTWKDANAYCAWAGKRLPTEAEWEKAAHGNEAGIYPWGDDPEAHGKAWFCENCIYDWQHPDVRDDFSRPAPVGSFPEGASPYGVYDMAGNVWEWVFDRYGADTYAPGRVNPTGPESGGYRVIRGGAWTTSEVQFLRTTYREARGPLTAWIDVGFRCAMDDDRAQLIFKGQPTETPTSTPTTTPTRTPGPTLTPTITPTPITPTPLPADLPNYKLVFAGSDGVIYTVNADGSNPTALTEETQRFHSPAWSPAGGTIAMIGEAQYGPAIYFVSTTGRNLRVLFEGNRGDGAVSDDNLRILSYLELGNLRWSADGKRLLFNSMAEIANGVIALNLHTISVSGGGFASLAWGIQGAWSPTGNQMAVALAQDPDVQGVDLVKHHVSLSGEPVTLSSRGVSTFPAWSPDERFVAYLRTSGSGFDLHIIRPDVSDASTLGSTKLAVYPAWSPDGQEIALADYGTVNILRRDGHGVRTYEFPEEIVYLEWSPDGTRLALITYGGRLYVMRADGSDLTLVAENLSALYATQWLLGYEWQPAPIWSPQPQMP